MFLPVFISENCPQNKGQMSAKNRCYCIPLSLRHYRQVLPSDYGTFFNKKASESAEIAEGRQI